MRFFLGSHHAEWLARAEVPLFVSRRTLARRRALPRARGPWALDSGGFTELSMHGTWTVSPRRYAAEVRRFRDEIGGLAWAAPQDWMCEPAVLAKTKLTVEEHQRRTVENFLELREVAPDLPWVPVLQGWAIGDYWRHEEAYAAAGIDLASAQTVGVGTVCRRQNTTSAVAIMSTLARGGLRLHGFGFKLTGLRAAHPHLASADSLAWSLEARKHPPMPGHTHASCANCMEWALLWRERALAACSPELAARPAGALQLPPVRGGVVIAGQRFPRAEAS